MFWASLTPVPKKKKNPPDFFYFFNLKNFTISKISLSNFLGYRNSFPIVSTNLGLLLKNIDVIDCCILGGSDALSSITPQSPFVFVTVKYLIKKMNGWGFVLGYPKLKTEKKSSPLGLLTSITCTGKRFFF